MNLQLLIKIITIINDNNLLINQNNKNFDYYINIQKQIFNYLILFFNNINTKKNDIFNSHVNKEITKKYSLIPDLSNISIINKKDDISNISIINKKDDEIKISILLNYILKQS